MRISDWSSDVCSSDLAYSDSAASLPPGINLDKSNEWAFDILEIFRNAVMFLSANLFGIIRLWPTAADRTHCELEVYLHPASTAAGRVAPEYGVVSLREGGREDMKTAVWIQRVRSEEGGV